MSHSHALAEFSCGLDLEHVPAEVVANARLRVLDTVGVCLASVGMEYADAIDFKPYPCGHISHPYMDCARELRSQHKLRPEDIAAVELRVPTHAVPILCEPLADKQQPASAYAARFSLPYSVAVVFALGRAGIDEFSEERIRDPEVLALAARTSYVVDDTLPFPQAFPGWVRIRLRDGREFERRMDASRGSRELPMSAAELYEKFSANVARCLPAASARAIWEAGISAERLGDINEFTRLLAG